MLAADCMQPTRSLLYYGITNIADTGIHQAHEDHAGAERCVQQQQRATARELAALAAYALYRVVKGLAKPADEQTAFWPASWVTPVAAEMDPRGPEEDAYDEGTEEFWDDEDAGR